jgi:16S rRNA (adenine(1408)-N(1))-methyltransferase
MHVINGKQTRRLNAAEFAAWRAACHDVTIDLGTGDGRFVRSSAMAQPDTGFVGVDLCAANLREAARRSPANALFVVADALALPLDLAGIATRVTIQFPWGSLLRGLLESGPGVFAGIAALGRAGAALELAIRLNAGALAEEGWTLEAGTERVARALQSYAGNPRLRAIGSDDLRRLPTTWAKRLAFGRDPRAVLINARLNSTATQIASDTPAQEPQRASVPGQQHAPAARGDEVGQAVDDQEAAFQILNPVGERVRRRVG